jgi:hypothetical protein
MQDEHYDGHHFDLNMNTQVLADPLLLFSSSIMPMMSFFP